MSHPKKKRRTVVNMRLKAPADVHASIVIHQGYLNKISDYEVSLEEASIDLIKKGIESIPAKVL